MNITFESEDAWWVQGLPWLLLINEYNELRRNDVFSQFHRDVGIGAVGADKSAPTDVRIIVLMSIIGPYR